MKNTTKQKDTTKYEVYKQDNTYTPIEYLYEYSEVTKPVYKGRGSHSVEELEKICRQFDEYTHVQQIIKQNAMVRVAQLKQELDELR